MRFLDVGRQLESNATNFVGDESNAVLTFRCEASHGHTRKGRNEVTEWMV